MNDKILVDTSAWIASFRKTGNQKLKDYLRGILDLNRTATTNVVILELLQGCKSKKEYEDLKSMLEALPVYQADNNTWSAAYEMGYSLRRKGITVPTVDILICSIAKSHSLIVLHHDRHMKLIAKEIGISALDFM